MTLRPWPLRPNWRSGQEPVLYGPTCVDFLGFSMDKLEWNCIAANCAFQVAQFLPNFVSKHFTASVGRTNLVFTET